MKTLIYILLCLVIAVAAGMLLGQDTGQVVLTLPGYSIQTSTSFFVLLLLTLFIIFYVLLRGLFGVLDFPGNYRRWKRTRAHSKSEFFLSQGYLALAQGNWYLAEKLLSKGARYSRLPLINYIGAARAAQQQGATERCDSYLRQAHGEDPDAEFAVGLTRAKIQLMQQQNEQAYATLRHLDDENPGQEQVKLMLLDTSTKLNDWQQSLDILQDVEKKGLLTVEEVRSRQLQVYGKLLTSAGKSGDLTNLKQAWEQIPKKLKKELFLIEVYVGGRLQYPDTTDCEVMIRKVIRNNPDGALVRLYGKVQGENPAKQLAFVEKLLKLYPTSHVVLLTAGRLYKKAEIWGKARAYFEQSLDLHPSAEAYYELATLYELEGNVEEASRFFQGGLKLAANSSEGVSSTDDMSVKGLPYGHID